MRLIVVNGKKLTAKNNAVIIQILQRALVAAKKGELTSISLVAIDGEGVIKTAYNGDPDHRVSMMGALLDQSVSLKGSVF